MGRRGKTILAIDIGTTKISAIAAQAENNGLSIIGYSSRPSRGVKKGNIINIDSAVDSIKMAVEEVETMAEIDISSAVVGISGNHIAGVHNSGVIPLPSREVKSADIDSVIEAAKAVVIPTDREVIQIIPQEFVVDNQDGIKHPIGMSGVRLEAKVYIVTGAVTAAQNIIKCLNRSGIKVQDIILQHLASAEAVLTDDEKELGCVLIDMGGGTTDLATFFRGSIRSCSVLPIGGNQITSDLAIGLRTPLSAAEQLKKDYRSPAHPGNRKDECIEVPGIDKNETRRVPASALAQIITARVEETFDLIKKELDKSGMHKMAATGAILTGGTGLLDGITDLAEKTLDMPVRAASPQGVNGITDVIHPSCSAGVGLAVLAGRSGAQAEPGVFPRPIKSVTHKMKQWFCEAFL